MDVTKAWFTLISASGIMFQSGNMIFIGTHCCIFITEISLNFKTAKLLKLSVNNIADTTLHMVSLSSTGRPTV